MPKKLLQKNYATSKPEQNLTQMQTNRIGFMQGRLSPKPAERIQAFPKDSWREEFTHAERLGFDCIEIIYDTLYLEHNPLETKSGRQELLSLSKKTGVKIQSICADYFMVKLLADERREDFDQALKLFDFAIEVECPLVEFPFVDSSSVKNPETLRKVTEIVQSLAKRASELKLEIAMETDLPPIEFRNFLRLLPQNVGANLDLGNSASLGFDVAAECEAFGDRILNVHIKDRKLGGTTVPLTTGNTDFKRAFSAFQKLNYKRDFILQTAPDPDYLGVAKKYQTMVKNWREESQK